LQNIEEAEEVTQDVFLTIFQKAYTFEANSTVSTWIYKITVNKSLNQIDKSNRKSKKKFELPSELQNNFEHPGFLLENKEKGTYLFLAIDTLLESQKTAFILTYIEGLPQQEVAQIMESSVKSVESLLQRAKANLRKKLIEMYPEGK
jgi:RNA polymerase sigma factor (sigma-70 family)